MPQNSWIYVGIGIFIFIVVIGSVVGSLATESTKETMLADPAKRYTPLELSAMYKIPVENITTAVESENLPAEKRADVILIL